MKAGTRITRGVMRPPSPVKMASVRAGSSSPAPPGPFSGEVGTSVSVGACGSSAVGAGTLSVVSVVSACVSVAVSVSEPAAGSSSSPPQPASGEHERKGQNADERPIETFATNADHRYQ